MTANAPQNRGLLLLLVSILLTTAACGSDSNSDDPRPCTVSRNEAQNGVLIQCPGSLPVELYDGEDGQNGANGQDGRDGQDGADGQDGRDGQDGSDGQDGRDGTSGSIDPENADFDQDGVTAADGDCDDFNNLIYPGAREISFDGIDRDCDGEEMPQMTRLDEADVLAALDADEDGVISFDEFETGCNESAMIMGDAQPGMVQLHATCGSVNSCRGMVFQDWGELYQHDCRAVNYCKGWSCVEMAEDQGRDGETLYADGNCSHCHSGEADGAFKIQVPPGEEEANFVAGFFEQSDRKLAAAIAFGKSGISAEGLALSNMPAYYNTMSPQEIHTLIAHLKTMPVESSVIEYPTPEAGE